MGERLDSTPLRGRGWRWESFRRWHELVEKYSVGRLVNVIQPSVFTNWRLLNLRLLISQNTGALSFLMITLQRDDSQVLEKPKFLGCKIGKILGEDLHDKGAKK